MGVLSVTTELYADAALQGGRLEMMPATIPTWAESIIDGLEGRRSAIGAALSSIT
jgi:hypothetical protein